MTSARDIEQRAATYLLRRQEPGWTEQDQAELDAWLKEATAHEVAYLRQEYGWLEVDRLAALRGADRETAPTPRAQLPSRVPFTRGRRLAWAMICTASLVGVIILIARSEMFTRQTYTTEIGARQTLSLADGSRVELNTNTRLQARINEDSRIVWLRRGEAYFDVAHDVSRPFIVDTGARRVKVLGTKFSVRRDLQRLQVAVAEGRVQLEDVVQSSSSTPVVAESGEMVVAEGEATPVKVRSIEAVARDLRWREGLLVFDQTSLVQAAEQFNRYSRKRLVISKAVADIRVGGTFEATNVEGFARLLQTGFGLKTTEVDGEIYVSD